MEIRDWRLSSIYAVNTNRKVENQMHESMNRV